VVNGILLSVGNCCVIELYDVEMNKYRTFTCPVLSKIVNRTFYQKKLDGPVKYYTPGNPNIDSQADKLMETPCSKMLSHMIKVHVPSY